MIESVWQFSNNKLEKSKTQPDKPSNESFNTLLKDQQSETAPFKTPPKNTFGQSFSFKNINDQDISLLLKNFKNHHQNKAMFLNNNNVYMKLIKQLILDYKLLVFKREQWIETQELFLEDN